MKRSIIFLVLFVMLGATMAFASPGFGGKHGSNGPQCDIGRGGHGGHGGDNFPGMGMILKMADEIGLDEKQKTKIAGLMEKNGAARIDKQAELDKAQLKMKQLRLSEAGDKKVLAIMDKIGLLKTDLRKMKYIHRQEFKSILTEEQIEKISQFHGQQKGKHFGCDGYGAPLGHPSVPDAPHGSGRHGR